MFSTTAGGNEHKQFSDKQKAGGHQHIYSARTTRVNESVSCKVSMFLNTTEGKNKSEPRRDICHKQRLCKIITTWVNFTWWASL